LLGLFVEIPLYVTVTTALRRCLQALSVVTTTTADTTTAQFGVVQRYNSGGVSQLCHCKPSVDIRIRTTARCCVWRDSDYRL